MKKVLLKLLICLFIISLFLNCDDNATEPKETKGTIQGTVKSALTGNASFIHPAYVFLNDTYLATTDEFGNYSVSSIEKGTYDLTCSALFFRDSIEQVQVSGGKTVTHDFYLTPDSSTGKVYGEFQDMTLLNESLISNPDIEDWIPQQIFNDITGATIQSKTLQYNVPDRKVHLSDSLLTIADNWGQYWFQIQCGTYYVKGSCEGYKDTTQVIKVLPDTRVYVNFFLHREQPLN